MITLTPLAIEKVVEIRKMEDVQEDGLRIKVRGGGCGGFTYELYFDDKSDLDREFDIENIRVFIDEMSLMYLMGVEIDYEDGLMGSGFKFNNPNTKSTCGCGSSFSV